GLLIDEDHDTHLLHVAASGTWRRAEKADNQLGLGGPTIQRLRARPELRDAIGGFGDGATLPGDSGRMVDTGNVTAASAGVVGTELLYINGPFSVQGEWAIEYLNGTTLGAPKGRTMQRSFNGGYVQVAYTLTGETRAYNKAYGILDTFYFK